MSNRAIIPHKSKVGFNFIAYPMQIWENGIDLTETEFQLWGYIGYRIFKNCALDADECLRRLASSGQVDLSDREIMDGASIGSRNSLKTARDRFRDRKWMSFVASGSTRAKMTRYSILLGRQGDLFASENDVMAASEMDSLRQKKPESSPDCVKKERNEPFIASKKDGIEPINIKEKKTTKKKDKELSAAQAPRGKSAPSHERAIPDPRHHPTEALIQKLHKEKFAGVACQWDGSEGTVLKKLLAKNKSWTQADIDRMVNNFFDSEKNSGRPRTWLPNLSSWLPGPKDRFNIAIGATNARMSKQEQRAERTAGNFAAAITRIVASGDIPGRSDITSAVNLKKLTA